MSLCSVVRRGLAGTAVAGAVLASVAVVPAAAGTGTGGDGAGEQGPRLYQGVVTARDGMWLRDRPDRGSRRIRFVRQGETVSIFCKTGGQNVRGNPLWYLLTDGTWAWGAARYIDNVGPAPRWC